MVKGAVALGVIGLGLTIESVCDNYHSGYGVTEATLRSSIDMGVALGSLVAGAYFTPFGGIVVGTVLSGAGEIVKNLAWGKGD